MTDKRDIALGICLPVSVGAAVWEDTQNKGGE